MAGEAIAAFRRRAFATVLASDPEQINGCFHKFASCADLQG